MVVPAAPGKIGTKLLFLTHDDERAPAAAASEEREKSVRALRWIDPATRSTDLDFLVCIASHSLAIASKIKFRALRPTDIVDKVKLLFIPIQGGLERAGIVSQL